MLIKDRDLLTYDPCVFEDMRMRAAVLFEGEADLDDFTLEVHEGINDFAQQRIGIGSVILVSRTPLEVTAVMGPLALSVSRIRPDGDGPGIAPMGKSGMPISVVTFTAQIRAVYFSLLRMAGIEPELSAVAGQATAAMILNPGALRQANALGALAMVYQGAGMGTGIDSAAAARGAVFQRRFEAEVERCLLHLDMNGDGRPDAVRRLTGGPMLR